MKPPKLLIYLLVFVALAAYVYFGEIKQKEKEEARKEKEESLVHLDRADITSVELASRDGKTIALQKIKDRWVLTEPMKVAADSVAVSTLLYSAVDAKREKLIKEKDVDWKEYGLDNPRFRFTLKTKDGKTTNLLFGEQNPAGGSYYLRVKDDPELVLVADTLKNSLDKSFLTLRDKTVVGIAPADVDTVVVSKGDTGIRIDRAGADEWKMTEPEEMKVKSDLMDRTLRQLTNLIADDIIDEPKEGEEYGLADPELSVALEGKKLSQTLLIGKQRPKKEGSPLPPGRYAQIKGKPTVYVIPERIMTVIKTDVEELRDRSLVFFDVPKANKLEITLDSETRKMVKGEDGKWSLEKPKKKDAASWLVSSILWSLKDLQWTKRETAEQNPEAAKLLDAPTLTVRLSVEDREKPLVIQAAWPVIEPPKAEDPDTKKEPEASESESAEKADQSADDALAAEPAAPDKIYAVTVDRVESTTTVYTIDGEFIPRLRENLDRLIEDKD